MRRRIQIVVTYADHQVGFYEIPAGQSWKVDAASRCLVVGTGVPRTHVPLDRVLHFEIVEIRA